MEKKFYAWLHFSIDIEFAYLLMLSQVQYYIADIKVNSENAIQSLKIL